MNEIRQKFDDGSEKILRIRMPFDKRHSCPEKNYGIGSMFFAMIYLKNNNAMQFTFSVPFYLPHVARGLPQDSLCEGLGYDVGYHADKPQYEGQSPMDKCNLLTEGKCYYDGSSLAADERYKQFLLQEDAFDWVWKKLAEDWQSHFGNPELTKDE